MTSSSPVHVLLRKAGCQDLDAIMAIETEQFTNPWKRKDFASQLNHDIAFFYVAQDPKNDVIAGYILFWVIGETIELHNIAVSSGYKKKGIGKKLLDFLMETARSMGVVEVFLEVRASNSEAIGFYEAFLFQRVATRQNYYSSPTEDAFIYQRTLAQDCHDQK